MSKKLSVLALAAMLACGQAAALSIGSNRAPLALGQPLDVVLPVQLAAGEVLERDCVHVEVMLGESRLAAEQLAVTVERGADASAVRVRVRSGVAVDEPVVSLKVAAGCPTRLTRTFVLFPEIMVAAAGEMPPATAAAMPPVPEAATLVDAPAAEVGQRAAAIPSRAAPASAPPARRATVAAAPRERAARAERPRRQAAAAKRSVPAAAPSLAARAQPRLQVDLMEPSLATIEAQARANVAETALREAQTEATQARRRLAEVETALAAREAAAAADRAAVARLERELADLRAQSAWWPALAALLAGTTVFAGGLAWRARSTSRRPAWWQAEGTDEAEAPAAVTAPDVPVPPAEATVVEAAPTASAAPVAAASSDVAAPADLLGIGLDELIDLEQQVEFLVVLGQDESAIDLLREQLRRSGGRAPLPQLRLLEIYRRTGQADRYTRLADRMHERFNVRVPAWDDEAPPMRPLADDEARTSVIEACWRDPRAAQRLIAAIVARADDGAPPVDLAAFDDLLLLYRVAADREVFGDEPAPAPATVVVPVDSAVSATLQWPATEAKPAAEARRKPATARKRSRATATEPGDTVTAELG